MQLDLTTFAPAERATLVLRGLYEAAGYRKYRMSRFEEYALYQRYERFLPDTQVLTFTDLDGRLRAIQPDVTLSIAKSAQPAAGECKKYYYIEQVCRPSRASRTFAAIDQMGLECIGAVDATEQAGVVRLAVQSLAELGGQSVLVLGHMGFLNGLLDAFSVPQSLRRHLLGLLDSKNPQAVRAAALEAGLGANAAAALAAVLELRGPLGRILPLARVHCHSEAQRAALAELQALGAALGEGAGGVQLDLGLTADADYYNGLIFSGYLSGVPSTVLKGGRYDRLMHRFTPGAGAVGFALYLNELGRLPAPPPDNAAPWLNIALPKGRLGDAAYGLLAGAGYGADEDYKTTRRLVVENPAARVRYFLVKPSDVAIYVEHGAADVGIVGKDILAESEADVYELLDTGLGACRMCVAGPADFQDDSRRTLRVATKFPAIARACFDSVGRDIEIIRLNGSIELAPLLGLCDVIVDIVETGATLRENGLAVLREFMPISARLIANKSSYRFKQRELAALVQKMKEALPR